MGATTAEELQHLAEHHEWPAILALLTAAQGTADEAEITRITRWYNAKGRAQANKISESWHRPSQDVRAGLLISAQLEKTASRYVKGLEPMIHVAFKDPGCTELVAQAIVDRGDTWVDEVIAIIEAMPAPRASEQWSLFPYPVMSRVTALSGRPALRGPRYLAAWLRTMESAASRPWSHSSRDELTPDGVAQFRATLAHQVAQVPDLVGTTVAQLGYGGVPSSELDLLPILVARLVADGGRVDVITAALNSFARRDKPAEQDSISRLLLALEVGPDDVEPHLPLLLGALPIVAPSVVTALLPSLLVAVESSPEDALDLTRLVLARKGKAPKLTVLTAAAAWCVAGGPLADVGASTLRAMAEGDDAALADRANKALAKVTGSIAGTPQPAESAPPTTIEVDWADVPPPPVGRPHDPIDPSPAGIAAATAEWNSRVRRNEEAAWIELLWTWRGLDEGGLKAAVTAAPTVDIFTGPRGLVSAQRWAATGTPSTERTSTSTSYIHRDGELVEISSSEWTVTPRPTEWFTDFLIGETLTRPLDGGPLLSTPTADVGTLDTLTLAARIQANARAKARWRPYDLQQALFRLPVPAAGSAALAADLEALKGLKLRGPKLLAPDGVDLTRRWLRGERFAVPGTADGVLRIGELTSTEPDHPIPDLQASGNRPTAVSFYGTRQFAAYLDVLPFDAEALGPRTLPPSRHNLSRSVLPLVTMAAARPVGEIARAALALTAWFTVHEDARSRALAASVLLDLAGRGLLSAQQDQGYPDVVAQLVTDGTFPLARASDTWEQVILGGGLKAVWPAIVAGLSAATALPRTPSGLADLLRVLRPYLTSVPRGLTLPPVPAGGVLPQGVLDLAAKKGGTKAQLEARAALSTLDVAQPRERADAS